MFKQLAPLLRQRSVLLTVAHLEEDQIRVNVMPKKQADGENSALTTPMSFTGTADELDAQLPEAIVSFVASHLDLKGALARAKEEMDAAAKAAQEEARNKSKSAKKPATEVGKKAEPVAKEESKLEQAQAPGLFDAPAVAPTTSAPTANTPQSTAENDEEDEILSEISADDPAAGSEDAADEAA